MSGKYVLGVDYGTESGRVLLVNTATGEELATHVTAYPHGVMDRRLPGGQPLEPDWALQHPDDYLEVLSLSIPEVLRASGVDPQDVIGIGIDFTSCTMLPVDSCGIPLCRKEEYQSEPHSWVKLWKHHAAQPEADRINELAKQTDQPFLARYGGTISSEWMLPKVMQILNEAPELYDAADLFVEAADWLVWQLTGKLTRSSCNAGYKGIWHKQDGYPAREFLKALDPRLEHLYETKLRGEVKPIGSRAGILSAEAASRFGLSPGTAVAVAVIDAHAAVPSVGVVSGGSMVLAMGTSLCHMLLSEKEVYAEGICGVVEDGIVPGLFGYEAGQPAVGDLFAWYVNQAVPAHVKLEAEAEGLHVYALLERKASRLAPGESGVLALDWWNGSRSPIMNADLSGCLIGCTLSTRPEDIYRALLEAAAFGTRRIIDTFEEGGVEVRDLYACGGLPERNRLLMQIFADVTGRTIKVAASSQTTALGAAIYGAAAAGAAAGGYDSVREAAAAMGRVREEAYEPNLEHTETYELLYREYVRLQDYFGRGGNRVMKTLKTLKEAERSR